MLIKDEKTIILEAYNNLSEKERCDIFEITWLCNHGTKWYEDKIHNVYFCELEKQNNNESNKGDKTSDEEISLEVNLEYDSSDEDIDNVDELPSLREELERKSEENLSIEIREVVEDYKETSKKMTKFIKNYSDNVYNRGEIMIIMEIIDRKAILLHKNRGATKLERNRTRLDIKNLAYLKKMCIIRYKQRQRHIPLIPNKRNIGKNVREVIIECRKKLDPEGNPGLVRYMPDIMRRSREQEKYWEIKIREKYKRSEIVTQERVLNRRPDILDKTRGVIYECKLSFRSFRADQYDDYKKSGKKVVYIFYNDSILIDNKMYSERDTHKMSLLPIKRHIGIIVSKQIEDIMEYI